MKRYFSVAVSGYIFILLTACVACFGQNHNLQPTAEKNQKTMTLELGQSVEQQIAGGEKYAYKLKLNKNQFIKIEVEQANCDVMLSLQSPEQINVFEYKDDNFRNGLDVQTAAVAADGEYELRVISFDETTQKGKFTLKFSESRPATDKELALTSGFEISNRLNKIKSGAATTDQLRQIIGDLQAALEKFRFAGNRKYEALTLSSIGAFHTRLGEWNKAVELQKQALEINRSIGAEEDVAVLLTNLGNTYLRNNEPQKALEALYESVSISARREDVFNQSRALSYVGGVYESLSDPNRALTYHAQALEKAQAVSETNFIAVASNDMGEISFALGESQKAVEYFQKSIEASRKAKNKRLEGAVFGNLGQVYFALGNQAKAFEALNEALSINRALTDKIGEAAILKKFGKIHLTVGETNRAIEFLNQSLVIYRTVEDGQNLADTLLLLAKAEAKKDNLDAAQRKVEEAINLVEKIRSRVQTSDLRDSFSANLQSFYGFYVELLMRRDKQEPNKNYAALAFDANERGRARGLLNLLAESNANIREGVDAKLLQKENELKNLLSARLENLTRVLNGGKSTAEEIAKLKSETEQIRADYEQTQTQIRQTSPRYSALTQPKTLDVKAIQTQILDTDSVLLEYALGEAESHLFIVTKDNFQTVALPAKTEIEKAARQFYDALTARNAEIKFEIPEEREKRVVQSDADLQKLSQNLSQMILAPAADFLTGKRLLIVGDGALQYVPFAALVIPDSRFQISNSKLQTPNSSAKSGIWNLESGTRFLIEANEIINLPSASALAVLRNETRERSTPTKTLAILADPIFDKRDERFQEAVKKNKLKIENKPELVAFSKKQTRGIGDILTREGLGLSRLPFTRREADLIAALVPANQQKKLLDFEANRSSAMSAALSDYRFVHFATHGFINNENPELSGIVLSMFDETGAEKDGFLRVGDVYNLKLPAEMVVLSGCKTGLGKEIKGEGLVGLTRGFMYAGAKRVAVSLWDVNDEATAELMARFYREMLGAKKLHPASALRQAQISMMKDKRWQNPYFWATFVLQGEPK